MNIAIIDDLQTDRENVVSSLCTFFSGHHCFDAVTISEFESGEAFLKVFVQDAFHFIFIDYYMDGISGLETAKKIRDTDDHVILVFITNSRDYAIDGYKVKASGYLLKPFKYNELEDTMIRIDIKKVIDRQFIELDTKNRPVRILLNDIIYCDVAGHYVQIHTHNMGLQKFRMTFSCLTRQLGSYKRFLSCYRGCIINMMRVEKVGKLNFCMDNGEQIPFCKKEHAALMNQYTDYLFEEVRQSQR